MLSLEHIDPRNGVLVSGLRNEANEIVADYSYNSRKSNRFVPYRVCDHPAPVTFGDFCEFLIEGEWVVCEFGGEIWWKETNKIGCNATARAKAPATKKQKKAAQKTGLANKGRVHNLSPEAKARKRAGSVLAGKATIGRMWFINSVTGETTTSREYLEHPWIKGRSLKK